MILESSSYWPISERECPLVDLATIKTDLPDWPDKVIELWLLKLANRGPDTGWPPPEPFGDNAWKHILGDKPLSWWKSVTWQLEERDLNFDALSQDSRSIVNKMLDAHINNKINDYTTLPNSKARFESAALYVAENGTFPEPLVGIELKDGLSVLDGNHRMTALCYCQKTAEEILEEGGVAPAATQKIWMGSHPRGEVPD
jgi:hypothetical protein